MSSLTLVLTLLAVTSAACESDSHMNSQDIGDDFKFLVEIQVYALTKTHVCSGSILNQHWIITTAYCIEQPNYIQELRVSRFGNAPAKSTVSVSRSNIVAHPSYPINTGASPQESNRFNLALLRTTQPIQFNHLVQPVPLGKFLPQGQAFLAGYGLPGNPPTKTKVMLTHCPEVPAVCSQRSGDSSRANPGEMGGPVVMNGALVGLLSRTAKFCQSSVAINVFVDIQSNYDWIESVIRM